MGSNCCGGNRQQNEPQCCQPLPQQQQQQPQPQPQYG